MNNELYHHGIKGQKWGVRRFQNPDGTLTESGKKRYANELKRQIGNRLDFGDNPKVEQSIKSHVSKDSLDSLKRLKKQYQEAYRDSQMVYKQFEKSSEFKSYLNTPPYERDYDNSLSIFLNKNPDLKKKFQKETSAWQEYDNRVNAVVEELLGDYKNLPIKQINNVGFDLGGTLSNPVGFYIRKITPKTNVKMPSYVD